VKSTTFMVLELAVKSAAHIVTKWLESKEELSEAVTLGLSITTVLAALVTPGVISILRVWSVEIEPPAFMAASSSTLSMGLNTRWSQLLGVGHLTAWLFFTANIEEPWLSCWTVNP